MASEEFLARKFYEVLCGLAPTFGLSGIAKWDDLSDDEQNLAIAVARVVLAWHDEAVAWQGEDKVDGALDEVDVPVEVVRWWPDSVQCQFCKAIVEIKEDPRAYIVECTNCGECVIVEPVVSQE